MRKIVQKRLMAITIIFLMGASVIAVAIVSFTRPQQTEFKPLENYVVDGELDPNTEYQYYISGFTFVKFYYSYVGDLLPYVDQLPELYKTNNNQIQIIVQKIPHNETYITIINFNSEDTLYNITEEDIYNSLCENLIGVPIECLEFNTETNNTSNATDDANATVINNTNTSA